MKLRSGGAGGGTNVGVEGVRGMRVISHPTSNFYFGLPQISRMPLTPLDLPFQF